MTHEEQKIRLFDEKSLQAYCNHSEVDGFIFTTYQGRSSQDESNGYCIGFQNGYKQALIDFDINNIKQKIEEYIKSRGYTWSYESIILQYEEYKKGNYVSHTAKEIINNAIEPNDKDRV